MTGMVVAMLAFGMLFMVMIVAALTAMDMGMLVLMVMGVDMVMLVGMGMNQITVAVGVLVAVMVGMLVIMAVAVFSFHGALLVSQNDLTSGSILQHADFIVNTVPRILFSGVEYAPDYENPVSYFPVDSASDP